MAKGITKRGPGYQLRYDESDKLVERMVEYGAEDDDAFVFESSATFQQLAVRAGILGVLNIQNYSRDANRDYFYPVSGLDTDLFQLTRDSNDGGAMPPAPVLCAILLETVKTLADLGKKLRRTHGRLRLKSILVRLPPERSWSDFRLD